MKTITEQNAETKEEISALIYAHTQDNFHSFTSLVERMLDKYLQIESQKLSSNSPIRVCGLNITSADFDEESFKTSKHYKTSEDGHIVPLPMDEQIKNTFK